jgi:hypothetical protein
MPTFARYIRLLSLCGLLLAGLIATQVVTAQSETELRSTADYTYGQVMRFRLRAGNLGDVRRATLYFRPHTATDAYAVEVPFEPAAELDLNYALDLTQTRLPPFSSVAYWWELERADGATLRVPERTLSYVDDQFSWQWISKADPEGGGVVTVQWTGEDPDRGEQAFDTVLAALDRLAPYVPLDEVRPFNVFVYPSSADVGSAMRLAGQEWQPGQTYPELGVLLVTVVNPATAEAELASGIGRELTDLLLYQALGEAYGNVPRWLRVGLADVAAGGPDARSAALLADAVADGSAPTLGALCAEYPTGDPQAAVAGAQSGAFVRTISDVYGPGSVVELITAFAGGATCDEALATVLNATPAQVTDAWRAAYQAPDPERERVSQAIIWVVLVLAGFGLAALLLWRGVPRRGK